MPVNQTAINPASVLRAIFLKRVNLILTNANYSTDLFHLTNFFHIAPADDYVLARTNAITSFLNIKPKIHDVAVLHYVFFAFEAGEAFFAGDLA